MKTLLTGATGFLGGSLYSKLKSQGHTVYGLSRHGPDLIGDVTKPDLGLSEAPEGIDTVYHLVAIQKLGEDRDGNIWETNVSGTKNIIDFCLSRKINRLLFCSTAYTLGGGRNAYEKSKILCDKMVLESGIPHVTVFKPSVVMGTESIPYSGHLSQFTTLVIRAHSKAESVRRRIEDYLRLPLFRPVFRIRGDPDGDLNLIPIDRVVEEMARINNDGVFWLTHPSPPTMQQVMSWIGDLILVDIRVVKGEFKLTSVETIFRRLGSAFEPYFNGDDLPSDIDMRSCSPITMDFIHRSLGVSLPKNYSPLP